MSDPSDPHSQPLHHLDPFLADFLSRLDPALAASFTPDQLRAIKIAFGARSRRGHAIDLRRSVGFARLRFYVVLLAGRERRSMGRLHRESMASRLTDILATMIGGLVLILPLLWIVYEIKNAIGIDLIQHGGLHAAMQTLKEQVVQMFGVGSGSG